MSPRATSPAGTSSSARPAEAVLGSADAAGRPPPPPVAAAVFGPRLALAERYAGWLTGAGIEHGLLGPAEAPRVWERHLLNSAIVADLLPPGCTVLDVGSGAGLPGLPVAIRRPDLRVRLLEPTARRCDFLRAVTADLALPVEVQRGRVEDTRPDAGPHPDVLLARAVAPLARLVTICGHLVTHRGQMLALKGSRVAAELDEARQALRQHDMIADIVDLPLPDGTSGATVVRISRHSRPPHRDRRKEPPP